MSDPTPGTVLAIDHNPRNLQLLMQVLDGLGFSVLPVADLGRLDALLGEAPPGGLALVDVDGFEPAIWERCRQLTERKVVVLVLAGRRATSSAQAHCARCGACAVLSKPLSPRLLAQMLRSLSEEKS